MTLKEFFKQNPSVALAFSGGVDSAYLLYAGMKWAERFRAYYIKGPFQPEFELDDAKQLAHELGCEMTVLPLDVLSVPEAAANGPRRCYYCKQAGFTRLTEQAKADGFDLVVDGTNASDDEGDRPGMQAIRELGVRSPLQECGLTKADIRRLSKEAGLFTWRKPSYSCLATRVATGETITKETLEKIEAAEMSLFTLGFTDFRVRASGGIAKLQIPAKQMQAVMDHREEIVYTLGKLFQTVTLDLKAREESK
jgi:uncharacterized protein